MVDDTEDPILTILARASEPMSATEIAGHLGVSRQAIHPRLVRLVDSGAAERFGRARATRYELARPPGFSRRYSLAGLDESQVDDDLTQWLATLFHLSDSARSLVSYAVTEMANNAIDHSDGSTLAVEASLSGSLLQIVLQDDGIGAFERVRSGLELASHMEALQELSKGKTTTAPKAHTGEGLFFTSKAVEHFRLESDQLAWVVDRELDDMAAEQLDARVDGTRVTLEIDLAAPQTLESVFSKHTKDYEFSTTHIVIKLFDTGVRFISRSEAKRVMHNLERFQHIILDFKGVKSVGQGFADEVFRVWANANPNVTLEPINMVESVEFFVKRASG